MIRRFAPVVALWSLGVAWPTLRALADEPAYFSAHGLEGWELAAFAAAVIFIPPAALLLLGRIVAFWLPVFSSARVDPLLIGVLGAVVALASSREIFATSASAALVTSSAIGMLIAIGYGRVRAVRATIGLLALSAPLIAAWFLFLSPSAPVGVTKYMSAGRNATASEGSIPSRGARLAQRPRTIVLVVFDELPAHMLTNPQLQVDATRFPGFADFAEQSTWYRYASTVADETIYAVPAIISGRMPKQRAVPPIAAAYPGNLFDRLEKARYRLLVQEPVTLLCANRACEGQAVPGIGTLALDTAIVAGHVVLPRSIVKRYLPSIDQSYARFVEVSKPSAQEQFAAWRSVAAPNVAYKGRLLRSLQFVERVRATLDAYRGDAFIFVHIPLPHAPWEYLPDGSQYRLHAIDVPGLEGDRWISNAFYPRVGRLRALYQLAAADLILTRLLGVLRQTGRFDGALMAVTADHGASYLPGTNRRSITHKNFTDIASVPLLIKYPGQRRSRVSRAPARTIDVAPTLLAAAGAFHDDLDGTPLQKVPQRLQVRVLASRVQRFVVKPFKAFRREEDIRLSSWGRILGGGGWHKARLATAPAALSNLARSNARRKRLTSCSVAGVDTLWRRTSRGANRSNRSGTSAARFRAKGRRRAETVGVINLRFSGRCGGMQWVALVVGRRVISAYPTYHAFDSTYASLVVYEDSGPKASGDMRLVALLADGTGAELPAPEVLERGFRNGGG